MPPRKFKIHNSTFIILVAVVLVWLAFPGVALAHSQLLGSSPAAGVVLDLPPVQIQLAFSEGVGLEFSTIKLYDRTRAELPVGPLAHVGDDSTKVSVGIPSTLRPGVYTVVWRVISG